MTTDNASNIVKCCREAVNDGIIRVHIGCFAHIINLSVQLVFKVLHFNLFKS